MKKASSHIHFIWSYLNNHWWLTVLATAIITYILAMIIGMGQSIWFDESYSIMLAKHDIDQMLALTAVDAHPPLYYLYLKVWGSIFGWSEFALRSSSAILGGAIIVMAAVLIRRLFTPKVALAILPFIVIAPFLLRYDFELRMYALASLIGLIATWVMVRAHNGSDKRWWALYAVLVALGMYTLYMTMAIWFAHVVWLAIVRFQKTKSIFAVIKQPAVLAYVGAVALFAPYISTFMNQTNLSALPPGVGSVVTTEKMVGIVSEIFSYRPDWQVDLLARVVLLIALGLAGYIFVKVWHHAKQEQRKGLLLLGCLVFIPIAFFIFISYVLAPLFVFRYIAHISIYIYLLIGLTAVLGWVVARRTAIVYTLLVGLLLVEGVVNLHREGNYNLERTQYPSAMLVRQAIDCDKGTVVVTDDLYIYVDMMYYFDDCDLRFNHHEDPQNIGGFATLRGNPNRVSSVDDVSGKTLVHIYQSDIPRSFYPESKYNRINTKTIDKNVIDTYRR